MNNMKTASCHCGAVVLNIELPPLSETSGTLGGLRRCNCSLCRRKGAIIAMAPLATLKVVKGQDNLGLYQWNTKVAKHYFCKTCGIYTHNQRRSNPDECGFNVACLDEFDATVLANLDPQEIEMLDGASMSLVDDG